MNLPALSAIAPEYVASKEDLNVRLEQCEPLFMLKSKPLSLKTFWLAWNRVYWFRHLSGRILKPSMHDHFVGEYTASWGGYPCKPFSIIGKQNGEEHPEHLWPYLRRDIEATRPVWCGFENVANHLHIGYEQVRGELQELGYTVEEGIFSSLEAGAPHKRERLFILAMDYAQCEGLQGQPWYGPIQERWKNKGGSASPTNIFPRTRGISQFGWEEPRTVDRKSCMDFSANGYSFIEDMVRAAGNSVMEQTAEIAFVTLLNKHIANKPPHGASQRC